MNILSWGRKTGKTDFCINRYMEIENGVLFTLNEPMCNVAKTRLKRLNISTKNVYSAPSNKWWDVVDENVVAFIDDAGLIDECVLSDILQCFNVDTITVTRTYDKDEFNHPLIQLAKKHGFYNKSIYDMDSILPDERAMYKERLSETQFNQEIMAQLISDSYTWRRFKALYCKGVSPPITLYSF